MEDTMERSEGVVDVLSEDYAKIQFSNKELAILGSGKNEEIEILDFVLAAVALGDHAFIHNSGFVFDPCILACYGMGSVVKSARVHSVVGAIGSTSVTEASEDYSASITTGGGSFSYGSGKRGIAAATGYNSSATQDGTIGGIAVTTETGGKTVVGKDNKFGIAASSAVRGKVLVHNHEGGGIVTGADGIVKACDCAEYCIVVAAGWDSRAVVKGKNNIAVASGFGAMAKGSLGNYLILVEKAFGGRILDMKAVKIDGKKIKPNTYYKIKKGKIVKVKDKKPKQKSKNKRTKKCNK